MSLHTKVIVNGQIMQVTNIYADGVCIDLIPTTRSKCNTAKITMDYNRDTSKNNLLLSLDNQGSVLLTDVVVKNNTIKATTLAGNTYNFKWNKPNPTAKLSTLFNLLEENIYLYMHAKLEDYPLYSKYMDNVHTSYKYILLATYIYSVYGINIPILIESPTRVYCITFITDKDGNVTADTIHVIEKTNSIWGDKGIHISKIFIKGVNILPHQCLGLTEVNKDNTTKYLHAVRYIDEVVKELLGVDNTDRECKYIVNKLEADIRCFNGIKLTKPLMNTIYTLDLNYTNNLDYKKIIQGIATVTANKFLDKLNNKEDIPFDTATVRLYRYLANIDILDFNKYMCKVLERQIGKIEDKSIDKILSRVIVDCDQHEWMFDNTMSIVLSEAIYILLASTLSIVDKNTNLRYVFVPEQIAWSISNVSMAVIPDTIKETIKTPEEKMKYIQEYNRSIKEILPIDLLCSTNIVPTIKSNIEIDTIPLVAPTSLDRDVTITINTDIDPITIRNAIKTILSRLPNTSVHIRQNILSIPLYTLKYSVELFSL